MNTVSNWLHKPITDFSDWISKMGFESFKV